MPSGEMITHLLEVDAETRTSIGIVGFEQGLSSDRSMGDVVGAIRRAR